MTDSPDPVVSERVCKLLEQEFAQFGLPVTAFAEFRDDHLKAYEFTVHWIDRDGRQWRETEKQLKAMNGFD